jgi:hypothetical protein
VSAVAAAIFTRSATAIEIGIVVSLGWSFIHRLRTV